MCKRRSILPLFYVHYILQFKIQYVDYGNIEEVTAQSLVELPPGLANMKGLAIKIVMHNTRAKDISDKSVSDLWEGVYNL